MSERISFSVDVNNRLDCTYFARISATSRRNCYDSPRMAFAILRVS